MFKINQDTPPQLFPQAWAAAGRHLSRRIDAGSWLRSNLYMPFSEHLSFRLGNQIFMIYVDAWVNGQGIYPYIGNRKELFDKQLLDANAIGCILRMDQSGGGFLPFYSGWGLTEYGSGKAIDPVELISDAEIEMTSWEVLDFAIQVTRKELENRGKKITSWQSNLAISPSIWYQDERGTHWVIVKGDRYPAIPIAKPDNLNEILEGLVGKADSGYFASVIIANADDSFTGEDVLPLLRGHGLYPKFEIMKVTDEA